MSATQSERATPTGTSLPDPGVWLIDPSHSSIEAIARHLMVSKVRGRFESFSGTVQVAEDVTDSKVQVTMDAKSINTNEEKRDQHLRSEDFLYADEHPQLRFESTAIEHLEGDRYRVAGDLTIRGETHPVELDVSYFGVQQDPWGGTRAAFEASTKLNREDWDMTWNQALEAGGVMVGKELTVEIDAQLVKQDDDG